MPEWTLSVSPANSSPLGSATQCSGWWPTLHPTQFICRHTASNISSQMFPIMVPLNHGFHLCKKMKTGSKMEPNAWLKCRLALTIYHYGHATPSLLRQPVLLLDYKYQWYLQDIHCQYLMTNEHLQKGTCLLLSLVTLLLFCFCLFLPKYHYVHWSLLLYIFFHSWPTSLSPPTQFSPLLPLNHIINHDDIWFSILRTWSCSRLSKPRFRSQV